MSTRNALGIAMVSVPGGSFLMGSCLDRSKRDIFLGRACPDPDHDASLSETPQHTVSVAPFQIGKTEVTLGQFKAFIRATGRDGLVDDAFMQYNNQGDSAPVARVSWHDAQEFVRWLNQIGGGGWRLPTEAEWEYVCRAGGNDRFCATSAADVAENAWYLNTSNGHQWPVAVKLPNAWGVHDMSGNAWEWVQDCWHDTYAGAPTNGAAFGDGACPYRVLRGGGWNSPVWQVRAAEREKNSPDFRGNQYGFRLARSAAY